jgi:uncharacterized protein YaaW (UPF0174 family)/GTP-binding protein EngB required for normal cell division
MSGEQFKLALEGATVVEVEALAKILEVDLSGTTSGFIGVQAVERLWNEMSYLGSNDIAYLLRGFEGVGYREILADVCSRMKVSTPEITDDTSAIDAEKNLIGKLFADVWDRLTEQERAALLESLNLDGGQVMVSGAAAAAAILAGSLGGFGTFQLAVIVANTVARALLGRGLTFAGNAALTRVLGAALGPVGWVASGLWLAVDIMSPAFRKTVPAVVQIACLRQLTLQRELIGVMGHGSTGKDSLLRYVFGIDTKNIHPIPGATKSVKLYDAQGTTTPVRILNFPGFGDLRPEVEQEIKDQASNCSLILFLFNGAEIPKREEIEEFERYANTRGRNGKVPVIPILNKWDKADDDDRTEIVRETAKRLHLPPDELVLASMKDKPGNSYFADGVRQVRERINRWARSRSRTAPFTSQLSSVAGERAEDTGRPDAPGTGGHQAPRPSGQRRGGRWRS